MSDRDARISAAGVVQAVIASGAPANEWRIRAAYGLRLVTYMAARLQGEKPKHPLVPKEIENGVCSLPQDTTPQ